MFNLHKMGWVKNANKLGKYRMSYLGFRIYKKGDSDYVAVNKHGASFRGNLWNIVVPKIDIWYLENVAFPEPTPA